jgi:hypothetical protein
MAESHRGLLDMSGLKTFRGWRLVRDGGIGLALFAIVSALAMSDGAQAGSGLMTLPLQPSAVFSTIPEADTGQSTRGPTFSTTPWSNLSAPWAASAFPAFEKTTPFPALIPLGLLFSAAIAFSAALLRHVLGTYALARAPGPAGPGRQFHRSRRRFEP